MKIALLGYGKMGKMIEGCIVKEGKHEVVLKINAANRNSLTDSELRQSDVVIEFSNPASVLENIKWCLQVGVPVVVGTTGWYSTLGDVKKWCTEKNGTIIYASNFSIGVNIFFEVNRKLAALMKPRTEYEPKLTEIHHTQKKDAPSGTAITLANDLLKESLIKKAWVNNGVNIPDVKSNNPSELIILSRREEDVVGTHLVEYLSSTDKIEIKHQAFSREGFAQGALVAAEWIVDKKGIYEFGEVMRAL